MNRTGTPSPELVDDLRAIVAESTDLLRGDVDRLVDRLLPTIASVDENAHGRGRTDLPEWVSVALENRSAGGPAIVSLAALIADDEEAPPGLRVIASRFLELRYVNGRPRSRSGDPSTSLAAAEEQARRGPARPGGVVHRILDAYEEVRSVGVRSGAWRGGATSREIELTFKIRAAHKRTSELLQDGLLVVVREWVDDPRLPEPEQERDLVRKGSRVLAITDAGREELARLNRLAKLKSEREEERTRRRRQREERRAARQSVGSGS